VQVQRLPASPDGSIVAKHVARGNSSNCITLAIAEMRRYSTAWYCARAAINPSTPVVAMRAPKGANQSSLSRASVSSIFGASRIAAWVESLFQIEFFMPILGPPPLPNLEYIITCPTWLAHMDAPQRLPNALCWAECKQQKYSWEEFAWLSHHQIYAPNRRRHLKQAAGGSSSSASSAW